MTRLGPAAAAALGLLPGCTPPLEAPFECRAPLLGRVSFGGQGGARDLVYGARQPPNRRSPSNGFCGILCESRVAPRAGR